ncbi:MAG TPA: Ldh family oxidoreductase, partial [Hymenobacter sp.]|nr:Ldh family oxidoreductase [Hymenobacter sp.]
MIAAHQLRLFTEQIFMAIGCSDTDARLAADVLISADLRGVDSHGVARLPGYIRLYDHGRINPQPKMRVVHETSSTAVVDGDRGLGLVVG